MTAILQLFGLTVLVAGAIILVSPRVILGPLGKNREKISLHVLAVGMRFALGILLLLCASESKYPITIEVLGWLSIAAAIALGAMGRRRFLALMSWAFSLLEPYGRIGGLFAMLFGGFLVYAFL